MDKTVTIRQSAYNLCDKCEAIRQEDAQKRKENQAKTISGQFTVVNCPNVKTREPDAPIPAPVQQCNSPCSTKDGEAICCCFICQREFHLVCANLTRRPSKTSNWCCFRCKNVPTVIKKLLNSVSVSSASQKTLLDQHETLKAENSALKIQIAELVSKSKETSRADTSFHQDKETTKTTTNKESQTATASMTDLPSDSEDGEHDIHDISLVITPIDESTWITVWRRRRRPKSQSRRTKSVRSNFDGGTPQPRPYEDHPDRNGSHRRHSRRQNKLPFERRSYYGRHRDRSNLEKQTSFSEK